MVEAMSSSSTLGSDWASLPSDLLHLIVEKLLPRGLSDLMSREKVMPISHHINFALVCKHWQSVALQHRPLREEQEVFTSYKEFYDSFDSMGLQENLLKGIYAYGFKKPSAIQKRGIVPFCKGRSVVLQALSRTGKTTTFCCGILQRLDYGLPRCQALVLTSTSNLARRTETVMRALGYYLGVKVVHAFAGQTTTFEDQLILQDGVHVVVGTPGVVLDVLRRKALCSFYINMFVLDDATEFLTGSSMEEIRDIYKLLWSKLQIGVFSARTSPKAVKITRAFLDNPVTILGNHKGFNFKHFYFNVEKEEWKFDSMLDIISLGNDTIPTVVYVRGDKVKWLADKILKAHYQGDLDITPPAIQVGMDPIFRDDIVHAFKTGYYSVLIIDSLLAHCIDVQHASIVIIYDLPDHAEDYLHSLRQSGRFERKRIAISFVKGQEEKKMLHNMKRFCNVNIEELPSNYTDYV